MRRIAPPQAVHRRRSSVSDKTSPCGNLHTLKFAKKGKTSPLSYIGSDGSLLSRVETIRDPTSTTGRKIGQVCDDVAIANVTRKIGVSNTRCEPNSPPQKRTANSWLPAIQESPQNSANLLISCVNEAVRNARRCFHGSAQDCRQQSRGTEEIARLIYRATSLPEIECGAV